MTHTFSPIISLIPIFLWDFTMANTLPSSEFINSYKVLISFSATLPTKDFPEGEQIRRKYTPISRIDLKVNFEFDIEYLYLNRDLSSY